MGCIVEFSEPFIRFKFCQNEYKQKMWIDALLKYSHLDLESLASVIEVSSDTLRRAHAGEVFLSYGPAEELGKLFLLLFSD
ncbi:hypothetical protein [Legionella sp. CNM-4043-24]|uniref:hypothetical protein n=1 Tax=Legionella sp. CNM-4043-24 TaxID=3421646 RepID=UPI00403AFCDD